jgi:hypothetical protein
VPQVTRAVDTVPDQPYDALSVHPERPVSIESRLRSYRHREDQRASGTITSVPMRLVYGRLILLSTLILASATRSQPSLERVLSLSPAEGVFAYARISPDGRFLVYAAEARDSSMRRGSSPTVTVVDLRTQGIVFAEAGIDAYWSPDGRRFIYESLKDRRPSVSVHRMTNGETLRAIVAPSVGDYYSWGLQGVRDIILTITSHYFYLTGDSSISPVFRVGACEGVGVGQRPLLSHDGTRLSTFVRGKIVIRDLGDCENIIDTGMQGAKADFSWDGRYIAFHAPKARGVGYDIYVVDLKKRTVRTITRLAGSSFYPSWTRDGRLCFRYDGEDYRGFIMAKDVLSAPARALSTVQTPIPDDLQWSDVFPETPEPTSVLNIVMVWGTWSAHSPVALRELQLAHDDFAERKVGVGTMSATDPASRQEDISRLIAENGISLRRIPLSPERLALTAAQNQVPMYMLFRDGRLLGRRLGAQTHDELRKWVDSARRGPP